VVFQIFEKKNKLLVSPKYLACVTVNDPRVTQHYGWNTPITDFIFHSILTGNQIILKTNLNVWLDKQSACITHACLII